MEAQSRDSEWEASVRQLGAARPGCILARGADGRPYSVYCAGPSADGSCPQVGIGEPIACAGLEIKPDWAPASTPYRVPSVMTLCPVTLARALAVPPDTAFAD